jgi:hypothetical protein
LLPSTRVKARHVPGCSASPGGSTPRTAARLPPGYEQIRVTIQASGDFDDDQFAELASLTRYSPVRDIVSNPVPVAIDVIRG